MVLRFLSVCAAISGLSAGVTTPATAHGEAHLRSNSASPSRAKPTPIVIAQSSRPAADDAWQPPDTPDRSRDDDFGRPQPSARPNGGKVERDELAPIGEAYNPNTKNYEGGNSAEGARASSLRGDVWRGLDVDTVEKLLSEIKPPPRSPVMHKLWRQLMTANAPPPKGRSADAFAAVRARALYRAGLLQSVSDWLKQRPKSNNAVAQSVLTLFAASADLGLGRNDAACEAVRDLSSSASALPDGLKGSAIMISGYCAAADGNTAAAGLSAELAREAGISNTPGLAALDALAAGRKPTKPKSANRLTLVDYRILQAANARPRLGEVGKLKPALLVAIARDEKAEPLIRQLAAEAAFDVNAINSVLVAQIYRDSAAVSEAASQEQQAAIERAKSFTSAQTTRNANERLRHVSDFLKAAAKGQYYDSSLRLAAVLLEEIEPGPDIQHFADAAILLALTANAPKIARTWADTGTASGRRGDSSNWFGLIDISGGGDMPTGSGIRNYAEPARFGGSMAALEQMALSGAFKPDVLHKLATVLDSLAYQVPIPLWEAASKTPQPKGGFLPATGVLSELNQAAKDGDVGKVALLTMKAVGPDGPRGTHMIALGDTVRALKQVGFENEARQLAVEALLPDWPYQAGR